MAYGTIKVDTVTFTNDGVDKSVTLSGLVQNPTFSGNVTVTGTLSGVTVTGTTANFTSGNFTNISGGTHTITSGVFAAGSAASPSITFTGDLNTGIYSPGADQVAISRNGSESMRIDTSGRLLVGTSTSINNALEGGVQIVGTGANAYLTLTRFDTITSAPAGIILGRSKSGTKGTNAAVSDGDFLGVVEFTGADGGSSYRSAAQIGAYVDGAVSGGGAADMPGRLVFSTTADGASSPTERLRITSAGLVGVGTSSPGAELNIVKNLSGGLGAQLIVENQFGNAGSEAAILCRTNLVCKAGLHVVADDGGTGTGNGNYLYFTTTPGGSTTESERARIDSSGRLLVGTSSGSYKFQINALGSVGFAFDDTVAAIAGTFGTGGNLTLRAQVVSSVGGGEIYLGGSTRGDSNINSIVLSTSNTERMRIDSSGRVGIGTTGPAALLDVYKGSGVGYVDSILLSNSSANGANQGIAWGSATNISGRIKGLDDGAYGTHLIFESRTGSGPSTTTSERARIDSSGRLLVGTSSAQGTSIIQAVGNSSASTDPGDIRVIRGLNVSSIGSNVGAELGIIRFGALENSVCAQISAVCDANWSANDTPGRLVFSTTADGASSPTERMRITNGGYFKASNTGVYTDSVGVSRVASSQHFFRNDANALNVQATSMSTGAAVEGFTSDFVTGATGKHFIGAVDLVRTFIVDANGNVTNTNNSYGAISDVKLKENIIDANSQWDDLKALRVCNYNFKTGESTHTQIGLIAQEVELVSPGLVSESPDLDADGNELGTVTKSVNYSVLYMKAVKALQEAMERIEDLEARLDAANL